MYRKSEGLLKTILYTQTFMGNNFYTGPGLESTEQYYGMLAKNVHSLNGFYAKLSEYLAYCGEQIEVSDDEIAAYISEKAGGNL